MKLIIDIPEDVKRNIDTFKGHFLCGYSYDLMQAIKNGIPLDSNSERAEVQAYFDGQAYGWEEGRKALIDEVKAEIMSKHFHIVEKNDFDNGRTYGYEECLSILDNIGNAESEGK